MEDSRRDSSRTKRMKTEVKNIVHSYLQKRNYSLLQPFEISKNQQLTYSQIENDVAKLNSVLYSCSTSDPLIIDQNFAKYLAWLKEQKGKNLYDDLEQITGPLFCHFYIEILNGEHKEKASAFFRTYSTSFDKNKCDPTVNELINLFGNEVDISDAKEIFRSQKIVIDLKKESLDSLTAFVLENCHVVFLQVLHNWFDFHILPDSDSELTDSEMALHEERTVQRIKPIAFNCDGLFVKKEEKPYEDDSDDKKKNSKIQQLLDAMARLKTLPVPIFTATIGRTKNTVQVGVLQRSAGLVAFAERNVLNIMPLNALDNILNLDENVQATKFTNHSTSIYSIDISYSNTILATGSNDCYVCIYDLIKMTLLHKCHGHKSIVYAVKISPTAECLVSGSADNMAILWDTFTGHSLRKFVAHTAAISTIDFHPNCLYIATGSTDKNIRMWDIMRGNTLRLLTGCKSAVLAVTFNPNGKYLASASDDKKIKVWDLLTSKALMELKVEHAPAYKLMWDKTGRQICAAFYDFVLKVWDFGNLQDNDWENGGQQLEPSVNHRTRGRLLDLEYAFGTFGALLVTN